MAQAHPLLQGTRPVIDGAEELPALGFRDKSDPLKRLLDTSDKDGICRFRETQHGETVHSVAHPRR